jgi:hypothetical protein
MYSKIYVSKKAKTIYNFEWSTSYADMCNCVYLPPLVNISAFLGHEKHKQHQIIVCSFLIFLEKE